MWKGSYRGEPFDSKLALLRLLFNMHWILLITVLGTLLFGGGYYVKNVLMRTEKNYMTESTFKVDYADPDWSTNGTYINYMTWNTWINSKEFLDHVVRHLEEAGKSNALLSEENRVVLTARVDSDLRVPAIVVTSKSREICLDVSKAIELTMVEDFAAGMPKDVESVRVINPATVAMEVIPDVRPLRAFILSAVLTFFFGVTVFLLREWGNDSIWLMSTLHVRYGLEVLDTFEDISFVAGNLFYYKGKKRMAVCSIDDSIDTTEVSEYMYEMDKKVLGENAMEDRWIPVPALLLCDEVCDALREADGILLAVKPGPHEGKKLEYVLRYLEQQKCEITCAILWGADEKLAKLYYGLDNIR